MVVEVPMMAKTIILGAAFVSLLPGVANAGLITTAKKKAEPAALSEVKFRFDSSALSATAPESLQRVVYYAAAHPRDKIVLDAHCDPIGTAPYNIGLAIRRAESVRQQLVAMGVPEDQLVFSIYGEGGEHRASYAEDRRVTVWPTRTTLASLIKHTFAGDGTAVTWHRPMTMDEIQGIETIASR
jgi:hypothetical protein